MVKLERGFDVDVDVDVVVVIYDLNLIDSTLNEIYTHILLISLLLSECF